MKEKHIFLGRIVLLWIIAVCGGIGYMIRSDDSNPIFQFGPNSSLKILGICIDDTTKYGVVVVFCFINSGVRTLNHNILQSWIINTIQDTKTIQLNYKINAWHAYEISYVNCIYIWLDFFMYMNILLSQIDMLLIEVVADLVMTSAVTSYYLNEKNINKNAVTTLHESSC